MLENKKVYLTNIEESVHYSRFIASWYNIGGEIRHYGSFRSWLESFKPYGMTDKDVDDIVLMATCGKLELEQDAAVFDRHYVDDFDPDERIKVG